MKGKLITFEGLDCTGKTTQIATLLPLIKQHTTADIISTSEPRGTRLGAELMRILLTEKCDPITELMLMLTARTEHINQVVRPYLREGAVILCDRYIDSTMAYQCFGKEICKILVERLSGAITQRATPDLTLWIDTDIDTTLERMVNRGEIQRIDAITKEFYQRVREGYQWIADTNRHRVVVINGNQPAANITEQLLEKIVEVINKG